MATVVIVAIALLIVSISLKLIFWLQAKRKSWRHFLKSFFRFYSVYDMHDAPSKKMLFFWKSSNVINIFFWLGLAILIVNGFFSLNVLDS